MGLLFFEEGGGGGGRWICECIIWGSLDNWVARFVAMCWWAPLLIYPFRASHIWLPRSKLALFANSVASYLICRFRRPDASFLKLSLSEKNCEYIMTLVQKIPSTILLGGEFSIRSSGTFAACDQITSRHLHTDFQHNSRSMTYNFFSDSQLSKESILDTNSSRAGENSAFPFDCLSHYLQPT